MKLIFRKHDLENKTETNKKILTMNDMLQIRGGDDVKDNGGVVAE